MVTVKYSEISNFKFSEAMQKLTGTPVHGAMASQIHKVTRALEFAKEQIKSEYKSNLIEKYAEKDKDGKLVRVEGEGPESFKPINEEEFGKAQEEFGHTTTVLNCDPFGEQFISNFKEISASNLAALGPLYTGNIEKPSVPDNVANLR